MGVVISNVFIVKGVERFALLGVAGKNKKNKMRLMKEYSLIPLVSASGKDALVECRKIKHKKNI